MSGEVGCICERRTLVRWKVWACGMGVSVRLVSFEVWDCHDAVSRRVSAGGLRRTVSLVPHSNAGRSSVPVRVSSAVPMLRCLEDGDLEMVSVRKMEVNFR